jgi:alpha-beta hydrolase superfamily lysophospholipase
MDIAGLLLLLLAGLVIGIFLVAAHTGWVLTHPPRRNYAWAVSRGLPGDPEELLAAMGVSLARPREQADPPRFEEWTLRSRGRDLPVWDILGGDSAGPVVVVTHGWGDSRVVALRCVPAIYPAASRVVLWGLPGHGDAPGTCTLGTREVKDLLALLERLEEAGPDARILLYGSSMGAGISIAAVAGAHPRGHGPGGRVAAIIAESPYRRPIDPARSVLRLAGLPHTLTLHLAMGAVGLWLARDPTWATRARGFDRVELARRLKRPDGSPIRFLAIHGSDDPVCSVDDARAIVAAAPAATLVEIAGAAHNNLWTDDRFSPQCSGAVQGFIAQCAAGGA